MCCDVSECDRNQYSPVQWGQCKTLRTSGSCSTLAVFTVGYMYVIFTYSFIYQSAKSLWKERAERGRGRRDSVVRKCYSLSLPSEAMKSSEMEIQRNDGLNVT